MRAAVGIGRLLTAAAGVALLLAGCGAAVEGNPVSVFADPFKVAGLEAVDGPTGLRPNAKAESRTVTDTDGGQIDELAGQSISDLEDRHSRAQVIDPRDLSGDKIVFGATVVVVIIVIC